MLIRSTILVPALASFLSGNSGGHLLQMLLIWILPLNLKNVASEKNIADAIFENHDFLR